MTKLEAEEIARSIAFYQGNYWNMKANQLELMNMITEAFLRVQRETQRETAEECIKIADGNVGTLSMKGFAGGDEIAQAIRQRFLEEADAK